MINRLIALVLLIMLSPFFIFVAFLLFITQGRPILYYQKRVGHNFATFNLFKYRTMNIDDKGPLITVENDLRIRLQVKNIEDERAPLADETFSMFWGDLHTDYGRNYSVEFYKKF